MTVDTLADLDVRGDILEQEHSLPVLKVTIPPDTEEGSPWKLDRRDSGSLFWRRDSVACKTSRIKFRLDVDVREFHPRPEERLATAPATEEEDEEDIYSDDYILKHDMDAAGGWLRPLRPANLFGRYRRLRLPRKRTTATPPTTAAGPKESSVFMSLVCVVAILVTAWLQGSISPIAL